MDKLACIQSGAHEHNYTLIMSMIHELMSIMNTKINGDGDVFCEID